MGVLISLIQLDLNELSKCPEETQKNSLTYKTDDSVLT